MNKSKVLKEAFEWVEMIVISISIVLIVMSVFVRHSPVVGRSMYPTLKGSAVDAYDTCAAEPGQNDVLLISNFMYTPKSGDIIVTQANGHMENPLVKRVIAVGGQSLRIDFNNWQVYVDGELLEEDYVASKEGVMYGETDFNIHMKNSCEIDEDGAYIIPEGYVFCMGDNRNQSKDSRVAAVGIIDERLIVGKVLFRVYPFDRIGVVK